MKNQGIMIKNYILSKLHAHPNDIVCVTAKRFKVSRTTVHRHLKKLIQEKKILSSGETKNIHYYLANNLNREHHYKLSNQLNEYDVFTNDFLPIISLLPRNIQDILGYGFTEIFNNAIDHSYTTKISAAVMLNDDMISIVIRDYGVGIFKKVSDYFHLDEMREAVLQLSKGKMTTDPIRHSGEGIFFCSRVFDIFEINANGLHYLRNNKEQDWGLESTTSDSTGTKVVASMKMDSLTQLVDIFHQYQDQETLAFDRTDICVELSKMGQETLISRSQAKRILRNLEKFNRVTLDFTNIRLVGQGFIDEIFRVFVNIHPHISIQYINANEDVTFMIKRSLSTQGLNR